MIKKFKLVSMLLCCSLLLIGCSNNTEKSSNDKENQPVELNVSAAASKKKEVMADRNRLMKM